MPKQKNRGFTIIELIVVIAIIAVLATIVIANVTQYINKAKIARAKADASNIEKALDLFYAQYGDYPYNLNSSPTGNPCPTANCTTTFGHLFGEPYLTVSGVNHFLSEFYKSDWVNYNANYYVDTGFYGVVLSDSNGDGKIGCGTVAIIGGFPVMTTYGVKFIICQDCACGTGSYVNTGIFAN